MELPRRLILPCGNAAIRDDQEKAYRCNYCNFIIGSSEEPSECKRKREEAEPIKNDYWMDINDDPTEQYRN
jgi:hypothetical protein